MPNLVELQNNYNATLATYNNAVANQTAAETVMNGAYASLTRCVDGKGKGNPLSSGGLPAVGSKGSIQACSGKITLAACKSDCCKKETCEQKMGAYNSTVDSYLNTVSATKGAQAAMNAAKDALEASPEFVAGQQQEIEAGKTTRLLWTIAGITVGIIIIGWIVIKYVLKKA